MNTRIILSVVVTLFVISLVLVAATNMENNQTLFERTEFEIYQDYIDSQKRTDSTMIEWYDIILHSDDDLTDTVNILEYEKKIQDNLSNEYTSLPDIDKTDEDNKENDDIIDTDDYVFDKEVAAKTNTETESFLSRYRRLQLKKSISGPYPYETRFSADNLVTSWVIDPLKGFGILVETQMNDLLENQRFYGGIMATTDLKSGDLFIEYQYLKGLVDYGLRFDREVLFWETNDETLSGIQYRYTKNVFKIKASLPLDIKKPAYAGFFLFSIMGRTVAMNW